MIYEGWVAVGEGDDKIYGVLTSVVRNGRRGWQLTVYSYEEGLRYPEETRFYKTLTDGIKALRVLVEEK